MIPSVIDHPLRQINLSYDPDKFQADAEKEILAAYIRIHDELYQIKRDIGRQTQLLQKMARMQAGLKERLWAFQVETGLFEVALGFRKDPEMTRGLDHMTFDLKELTEGTRKFDIDFMTLYDLTKGSIDGFNALLDASEKFESHFEHFEDFQFKEMNRDWETMSLDLVTFDADYKEYKGIYQEIDNALNMFYEQAEPVHDEYHHLQEEVNAFYRSVERIDGKVRAVFVGRDLHDKTRLN